MAPTDAPQGAPRHDSSPQDAVATASPATSPGDAGGSAQLAALEAKLSQAEDRALRSQAELENVRKRLRRELEDLERYAAIPLLRDVLSLADDLDRAIGAAAAATDAASLLAGVKLVRTRLGAMLERHQCQPIAAAGAAFDPALHEAILQQPSADHPAGTVLHVALPGFRLHDRVVRPAQVVVSSSPAT